jgi:choline dehydrogenase-like flavoprotein
MLTDARTVQTGTEFLCDLCIVGSGPAGIAIADRLRGSRLSVIMLESGGFNVEAPAQSLYRGEVDGDPYYRLDACRWRLFGGSSNRWGGWCRPLEGADFTRRDWLPNSGWPIGAQTLQPFELAAAQLFELPNDRFDLASWQHRLPAGLPFAGTSFQNTVFQHSPETNFGETYRERLLSANNVSTFLYANLTEIRLQAGAQRIDRLEVATLSGRRFTIRPRATVLAAGGIENARLLLASRRDRPAGIGNEFDRVGRYFMEHLHVPVGHLVTRAGNNHFYRKAIFGDVRLRGVLTPTATAQAQHRLLATSIAIEDASYSLGTPFVGWPPAITFGPVRAYRNLRATRYKHVAELIKQSAQWAQSLPTKFHTGNLARAAYATARRRGHTGRVYSLYFRAEQAPDPENRIRLSERTDALGLPQSRLVWRVRPVDAASITAWFEVLRRDVHERGLGVVIGPTANWAQETTGGPHHMGTTRMSVNPRDGVVDRDCRVHSVDNLYVAGSSVFVTSGYANPTFALVTLALRLAEHLRRRLGPRSVPARAGDAFSAGRRTRCRP